MAYLQTLSTGQPPAAMTAGALAAGLRALAEAVEAQPALLALAADAMSEDFMASRAPPPPEQVRSLPV